MATCFCQSGVVAKSMKATAPAWFAEWAEMARFQPPRTPEALPPSQAGSGATPKVPANGVALSSR